MSRFASSLIFLGLLPIGGCTGATTPPSESTPTPQPSRAATPTPSSVPQVGSMSTDASPAIRQGLTSMPGYQVSLSKVDNGRDDSESRARGFLTFRQNCAMCHSSVEHPMAPDPRKNPFVRARDLSLPERYKFGTYDQALYRTILYGIPRGPMGNNQQFISENQAWDLVHFIKSTWPKKRGSEI